MSWRTVQRTWFIILLLACLPGTGLGASPPPQGSTPGNTAAAEAENDEQKLLRLTGLMRQVNLPDVRIKIAQLLHQVQIGLPPETFYKRLSELDLPKETRFQLMEVKKDIGNVLGDDGLRFFLGRPTPAGGSAVETRLLTWRRQMVMEGIRQVFQEFKGRNRIGGHEFRVYYAEIGGWATETPDEMRFEGDIDFSFVSGNRQLAWLMKLAFDSYVQARLGLTGQQADTVCTAHGMAEPEVYVGRHGAIFAERAMTAEEAKKLKVVDLEAGRLGGEIEGTKVLENIVYDSRALGEEPGLPLNKAPTEPGISMEMIRHFLHDIMHNPVYTDIDSFLKAAKYTFRSNDAGTKAFGLAPADPKLAQFVKTILDLKKKGAAAQVDAIREFFGGKLPWGVSLGPNQGGKSRVTLVANTAVLDSFWARCRDNMWRNAEAGFKKTLADLKAKAGKVSEAGEAAKLKTELDAVLKMMEIEFLLFDDPQVGAKVPASVRGLMGDLRSFYKGFMETWGLKMLTPAEMEEYRFLEGLLKQGGEWNVKTAMVALVQAGGRSVMRVNMYLDILDDRTLGELRGETGEWRRYLENTRRRPILDEWNRQGRGRAPPPGLRLSKVDPGAIVTQVETWMNTKIHNFCLTRKIRNVNMILGRSIQGSAAGRAAMTGMIAVNLAQEIPAYIQAFQEEGWQALATEFFRRRVPFGSVTEHAIMGRYGMAAWDTLVTFVPPLALFQVAGMIGAGVADQSWRIWWSEELEYFVDQLYEKATFVLEGTERVSEDLLIPQWRLAKVKYQDQEVVVEEFKKAKLEQIRAMIRALETPHREREFPIEYRYEGLTGILDVDQTLRINLEETDNYLFMLREMMKHPSVGEKLKDQYMDQWMTHWEQVKLNFILKTIAILEERRKAEQLQHSGKMEEVVEELTKATRKLKIEKEVEESLEEELGYEIFRYFKYLKDLLVGLKRDYYGQPDVWDEYEEGARITVRYLETYLEIVKARQEAEEEFAQGRPTDRGLRLMTGPYFLTGKAETDKSGHKRWRDLPEATRNAVAAELEAIKGRYVSPAGLEEKGYDQWVLGRVVRHDVWREAWRQANSMGLESHPEALAEIESHFSERDYQYDSNPAVARFKFHKESRDELVKAFEAHYRHEAEKLGQDEAECVRAEARVKEVETEVGGLVTEGQGLAQDLARTAERMEKLEDTVARVKEHAQRAKEAADKAAELKPKIQELKEAVCDLARSLTGTQDEDILKKDIRELLKEYRRRRGITGPLPGEVDPLDLLETLGKDLQELRRLKAEADQEMELAEKEKQAAEEKAQEALALPGELEDLGSKLAELKNRLAQAKAGLDQALAELGPEEPPARPVQEPSQPVQDLSQPDQPPAGPAPASCREPLLERLQAQAQALAALEKELADKEARLSQVKGAKELEPLLEELKNGVEAAAEAIQGLPELAKSLTETTRQAETCGRQALDAADEYIEARAREASAAIAACRFKTAAKLIKTLPPGSRRSGLEREYKAAQEREEVTRSLWDEARALYQGCDYAQALDKLNQALNQTGCPNYGQRITQAKTKAEAKKAQKEKAEALLAEAEGLSLDCRPGEVLAKAAAASAQSPCPELTQRIETLQTTAREAQALKERTRGLFEEADALYKNCQLDQAGEKVEEALGVVRCQEDRQKYLRAKTKLQKIKDQEAEAANLLASGQKLAQACDYQAALADLDRALESSLCAKSRQEIGQARTKAQANLANRSKIEVLLKEAQGLTKACELAAAKEKLTAAWVWARDGCPADRSRVEAQMAAVDKAEHPDPALTSLAREAIALAKECRFEAASAKLAQAGEPGPCAGGQPLREAAAEIKRLKENEAKTAALVARAQGLLNQGKKDQARRVLIQARNQTNCDSQRQGIGERITSLKPGGATEGEEEPESFFVAMVLHLPWPKKLPEVEKAPEGADEATKELVAKRNEKKFADFARHLSLSQTTITSFPKAQESPLVIKVTGEALEVFPREGFAPGAKFALGFKGTFRNDEGTTNLKAALLLKAVNTFDTYDQALAAYPKLRERIAKYKGKQGADLFTRGFTVDSETATQTLSDAKNRATLGPLTAGWSLADQKRSLEVTRMIVSFLGAMANLEVLDCFVATAVYGDPHAPELDYLRRFRDRVLLRTEPGTRLVRAYYRYGPGLARWVAERPRLVRVIRCGLDRFTAWLKGADWEGGRSRKVIDGAVRLADGVLSRFVDPEAGPSLDLGMLLDNLAQAAPEGGSPEPSWPDG